MEEKKKEHFLKFLENDENENENHNVEDMEKEIIQF